MSATRGENFANLRVVIAVLIVEAQTSVEDERSPMVFQLYVAVDIALMPLAKYWNAVVTRSLFIEVIAKHVLYVVELEVAVFGTE